MNKRILKHTKNTSPFNQSIDLLCTSLIGAKIWDLMLRGTVFATWIESQQGTCCHLVSSAILFPILNLTDTEVLIKIGTATSHCSCDAWNILAMKTHYIPTWGFMGEQMSTSE